VGKEVSIQKLFIGLPEKGSTSPYAHAFFYQTSELRKVCFSCAAIALFQQATNGVSLGGRFFMVGLKGVAPVTTLVVGETLRETVWFNVLSRETIAKRMSYLLSIDVCNKPTWIEPIKATKNLPENSSRIGMLRGLFWQPAKVELIQSEKIHSICDSCGSAMDVGYVGFKQEQFIYKRTGFWRHPHSPVKITDQKYIKLDSDYPVWRQFLGFVYETKDNSLDKGLQGFSPAIPVTQFKDMWCDK